MVHLRVPAMNEEDRRTLQALVPRAEKGDEQALAELRRRFDATPALWEELGNLAEHAQRVWVALSSGSNALIQQAAERKVAALRQELLGPAPSPLERLLVERIIACWLQVQYADQAAVAFEKKGGRFAEGDYWQKQQERAHRRYLSAIRTLAQVRRLLLPAVQMNIAEQQVNVLGQVNAGRPAPAADPDQQ